MFSSANKFLFVHIPKTGGNSIQSILSEYSDDYLDCPQPHHDGIDRFEVRNDNHQTHKHSTLREYRDFYPLNVFDSLFKFTVIRNTYERLISFYFSPHRGNISWNKNEFIDFIATVKPISHFIAFPAQSLEEGVRNVHFLIRHEYLSHDYKELSGILKIKYTPLPHLNKSTKRSFAEYYDNETIKLVYECFREEIDYFNFPKP